MQHLLINEADTQNHLKTGDIYFDQGDYIKAITEYDQAIAKNPHDAIAYNNRGCAYSHKRRFTEALNDYNDAIALNQADAAIYYNRGHAYHQQGDYTNAIIDYCQAMFIIGVPEKEWHQSLIYKLTRIAHYKEIALSQICLLPSPHPFIKSILTPGSLLNLAFRIKRDIFNLNLTNSITASVLNLYYQQATGEDAELSLQLATNIRAEMPKDPSDEVIKHYTLLLKNALFIDSSKLPIVIECIQKCLPLLHSIRKSSSPEVLWYYINLLRTLAGRQMRTDTLLDLLTQPLVYNHKHNLLSVISYIDDALILNIYISLLKQCANSEKNEKFINAFLEQQIEEFGLLNTGGGISLNELLKKHNPIKIKNFDKDAEIELTTFRRSNTSTSRTLSFFKAPTINENVAEDTFTEIPLSKGT